jgi:hypothetical protein
MDALSLQCSQRGVGSEGIYKRPPSFRSKIAVGQAGESKKQSRQSNGCHMTHSNMVSEVLVLRVSPSARPPSGPRLLWDRLERVSNRMDA